jgi:uncharacterized membrane protein
MTDAETDDQRGDQEGRPLFDVALHPHRSLGRTGFLILMGCVSLVCFAGGVLFYVAGAWPVVGFLGLDVILVYVAFKLNYRDARLIERVRLTANRLEIERVTPSGRITRWDFQPYWVQVALHDAGEAHCRLTLSSHGRVVALGNFLTPGERESLCSALKSALARCRCLPEAV